MLYDNNKSWSYVTDKYYVESVYQYLSYILQMRRIAYGANYQLRTKDHFVNNTYVTMIFDFDRMETELDPTRKNKLINLVCSGP